MSNAKQKLLNFQAITKKRDGKGETRDECHVAHCVMYFSHQGNTLYAERNEGIGGEHFIPFMIPSDHDYFEFAIYCTVFSYIGRTGVFVASNVVPPLPQPRSGIRIASAALLAQG